MPARPSAGMAVCITGKPDRPPPDQRPFPKWNSQKINPESEENFRSPKSDRQHTTIHHASTTNSPSKNHVQPRVFRKIPRKNGKITLQKNLAQYTLLQSQMASGGGK